MKITGIRDRILRKSYFEPLMISQIRHFSIGYIQSEKKNITLEHHEPRV